MSGRKGISIIVSIVLVIAITLAVALSAFLFMGKFQRSAQGQTESSTGIFLTRASTCIKLVSFSFNPVDNTSQAVIKNCGFREVDLGNESLYFTIKTPVESCSFTLNSSNCDNCAGKLGIGSFATLNINASEVECGSTLADVLNKVLGQKVEVVVAGKRASFVSAQTFVPEPVVLCRAVLNRTPEIANASACYNYTIKNLGNAHDAYKIFVPQYFFPGSPTTCGFPGHGCTGLPSCPDTINLDPIPVNGTANFSVFIDLEGGGNSCPNQSFMLDVIARSGNCIGESKTDYINQTC